MNTFALICILFFWIPVTGVLTYHLLWDLKHWQDKEYSLSRIYTELMWDHLYSQRYIWFTLAKIATLPLILSALLTGEYTLTLIGVALAFCIWVVEMYEIGTKVTKNGLPRLKAQMANTTVLTLSTLLILGLPVIYSMPVITNPFRINTTIFTLTPDIVTYMIFSCFLALSLDLGMPLITSVAVFLTWPIRASLKYYGLWRAANFLSLLPGLRVALITGTSGKTTVRQLLEEILKHDFNVASTKGTETSVQKLAETILTEVKADTQIFLADVNTFRSGELARIAQVLQPEIVVFTDIDDERIALFGSKQDLLAAHTEALEHLKPGGTVVLNGENDLLQDLATTTNHQEIVYYTEKEPHPALIGNRLETEVITSANRRTDKDGSYTFTVTTKQNRLKFTVNKGLKKLSGSILASIATSEQLGMDLGKVAHILETIDAEKLELYPTLNGDQGAKIILDKGRVSRKKLLNAVQLLVETPGRKKVLVTTGIRDLGKYKSEVYRYISRKVQRDLDLVITSDQALADMLKLANSTSNVVFTRTWQDMLHQLRLQTGTDDVIILQGEIEQEVISNIVRTE